MRIIDKLKKEYENMPWLKCAYCSSEFKGNHECDYEKLKKQNKRYREVITCIKETRYIAVSLTSHLDLIYEVLKELEGDSNG